MVGAGIAVDCTAKPSTSLPFLVITVAAPVFGLKG